MFIHTNIVVAELDQIALSDTAKTAVYAQNCKLSDNLLESCRTSVI